MDLMRAIAGPTAAALTGPYFHPILLVWLDWPGGAVRAHSGAGLISWGGETWNGVGKFGSVEVPEETAGGVPTEFSLSLVCDLPELATYSDAKIRQREGVIWLGATTEPGGNVLVGAPVEIARGTMDTLVQSTEVTGSAGATLVLYRLTVGMATGPGYRTSAAIAHSHEDQIRHYPGDTAGKRLVLAAARAEKTLWPEP